MTTSERGENGAVLALPHDAAQWLGTAQSERRALAERACLSRDREALWSLTEAFLRAHRTSGPAVSPHTLRAYRQSIELLLDRWTGETLLNPRPAMVEEFIREMEEAGASQSTVKARLAAVRALYRALSWAGVLERHPFDGVGPIRATDAPQRREPYSPAELETLLDTAGPVDRTLIVLSSRLGLSLSECLGLTWNDLDLETGRLTLHRGDHPERAVLLPQSVLDTLRSVPVREGNGVMGFSSDVRARQRMKQLCRRAGVPYRGVQALRLSAPGRIAERSRVSDGRAEGADESIADFGHLKSELVRVIADASETGSTFGLLSISIEELSAIEAKSGRDVTQAILEACARRIARIRRQYDVVARCPDRSFCVMLKHLGADADLAAIGHRFVRALHTDPVAVGGETYAVRARSDAAIGSEGAAALLRQAETTVRERARLN